MSKQFHCRLCVFLLVLFLLFNTRESQGQTLVVVNPDDLVLCGEPDTLIFEVTNTGQGDMEGIITISLPENVSYIAPPFAISGSGGLDATNVNVSADNRVIELEVDGITSGTTTRYGVLRQANCAFAGGRDTLEYDLRDEADTPAVFTGTETSSVYDPIDTEINLENLTGAALNPEVAVGLPFTRDFTVSVGSNGYVTNFFIYDSLSEIRFTGASGGTLNGTGDTIFISSADISTVGDGDGRLESGEKYTLQITQRVEDCAFIESFPKAGLQCQDGSVCRVSASNVASVQLTEARPEILIEWERTPTGTASGLPNVCNNAAITARLINVGEKPGSGPISAGSSQVDSVAARAIDMRVILGWFGFNGPPGYHRPFVDFLEEDGAERLQLTNFQIDGVAIPLALTPTEDGNDNGGYNADTRGYILDTTALTTALSGLQDLDGDGVFNDLDVGDTLEVTMTAIIPCLTECPNPGGSNIWRTSSPFADFPVRIVQAMAQTSDNECVGQNATNPDTVEHYQDSIFLGDTRASTYDWVGASGYTNAENYEVAAQTLETANPISDVSLPGSDTVKLELYFDYGLAGIDCPDDNVFLVLDPPPGVNILNPTDACTGALLTDYSLDFTDPDSIVMERVNPGPIQMAIHDFSFRTNDSIPFPVDFLVNCVTADLTQPIEYTIYHECDNSCGCGPDPIFCGQIDVSTYVNCPSPCDDGPQVAEFTPLRNTFGWTDYTMTTPIYPPLSAAQLCELNLKRVMPYDSMRIESVMVFNTTNVSGFDNFRYTLDAQNYTSPAFENVAEGTAILRRGGVDVATVDMSTLTGTINGADGSLSFDFTAADFGITRFADPDSIVFDFEIVVANNADFTADPNQNPGILATASASLSATTYICDSLPTFMGYHRPVYTNVNVNFSGGARFDNHNNSNFAGFCNTRRVQARFDTDDGDIADYYPNEFRPYYEVDSIVIRVDENYGYEFSRTSEYQFSNIEGLPLGNNDPDQEDITGTSDAPFTNEYALPIETTSGGETRIVFDNHNAPANQKFVIHETTEDAGDEVRLIHYLRSDACHDLGEGNQILVEFYVNNFFYSRETANHSQVVVDNYTTATNLGRALYTTRQQLEFQSLPTTVEAFAEDASFSFRLTNPNPTPGTSRNVPADSTWVYLSSTSGNIDILEVSSGGTPLPLAEYTPGAYWVQTGYLDYNDGIDLDVTYDYVGSCDIGNGARDDTLIVRSAWNCQYPTDPAAALSECNINADTVFIDVRPAVVQVAISQTQDAFICDTIFYALTISNSGFQYLTQFNAFVDLPEGTEVVPGAFGISYLSDSTAFGGATVSASGDTLTFAITDNWPASFGALPEFPGTSTSNPDSSEVTVYFQLSLNCGSYVVNSAPVIQADATAHCGETVNTGFVNASAPNIQGVLEPYGASIGVNGGTTINLDGCNSEARVQVRMDVQTGSTQPDDSIRVYFPEAVEYVSGSFDSISNSVPDDTPPVIEVNGAGQTVMKWPIPDGVSAGSSIDFDFFVRATPSTNCATGAQATIEALTIQGLSCPSTGDICSSPVLTAQAQADFEHQKPDLDVDLTFQDISNGQFTASGIITNNGSAVNTNIDSLRLTVLGFYCDQNNNGAYDPGDNILGYYTSSANIPGGGGTLAFNNISFTIDPASCPDDLDGATDNFAPGVVFLERFIDMDTVSTTVPISGSYTAGSDPSGQCICESALALRQILLPVNWLSVYGHPEEGYNQITWEVIEDGNTRFYELERYRETEDNWQKIATLEARQSTFAGQKSYKTRHVNPASQEVYRLRAEDDDGVFSYSKAFVVYNQNGGNQWRIFPNPASEYLNILNIDATARYQVFDLLGNQLLSGTINPGEQKALSVQTLPAGTYVLKLQTETQVAQFAFVVR